MLKWTKLANTLRLRLALRVVYADEALARREAEKSAACPVGFLEDADSRAQYNGLPNAAGVNPIWQQAYEWNENRMSAPMDSYLNGYKDPRISVYFVAAGDGKYHGVRQGVFADGANQSAYIGEKISNVNLSENSPVLYMAAAESYFLRAEAALRGWNMGGTARAFYEAGIRASFSENGVSGEDAYITNTSLIPTRQPHEQACRLQRQCRWRQRSCSQHHHHCLERQRRCLRGEPGAHHRAEVDCQLG